MTSTTLDSGYPKILWMLSGTATAALTISIGAMLAQAKLGPAHETQGARDSAKRRAKCGETKCEMQKAALSKLTTLEMAQLREGYDD